MIRKSAKRFFEKIMLKMVMDFREAKFKYPCCCTAA